MATAVYAAQIRLAAHYVNIVIEADRVFEQGGEGSLTALSRFDADRPQINQWQAWLAAQADRDDEAAGLLVALTHQGENILSKRLGIAETEAWYTAGLAAAQRQRNLAAIAAHLRCLANAYLLIGEYERGIRLAEEALANAEACGQGREIADSLRVLLHFEAERGRIENVDALSLRAIALYQQAGDLKGMAKALANLGWSYVRRGQWQDSEERLRVSYDLALRLGDSSLLSEVMRYQASYFKGIGAYAEASAWNEHALSLSMRLGDQVVAVTTMINQASNYDNLGDYASARAVNLRALSAARRYGLPRHEGVLLNNLGYSAYLQGDYAEAVVYMEDSMALLRTQQQDYNTCMALANIIPVYLPLRRYQDAYAALLEGLERALALDIDALKVTMVVAAVQTWVAGSQDQADDATRISLLDQAAYWSGLVMGCPGAEQENRDEVAKLVPVMEAQLGGAHFQQRLAQGAEMFVDEVVAGIIDLLRDGA